MTNERFCPHCGEVLTWVGNELTCQAGKMGLSQNMYQLLEAQVRSRGSVAELNFEGSIPGKHCYCCGTTMKGLVGDKISYGCERCAMVYPGLIIRRLVELHPHLKTERFQHGYSENA
jgi:hypothetical protein